jgi:hypothetical protein
MNTGKKEVKLDLKGIWGMGKWAKFYEKNIKNFYVTTKNTDFYLVELG